MRLRHAAAALTLAGASLLTFQAKAATSTALPRADQIRAASTAPVEPVYWAYRGGVRVWVGPPPGYYHHGYYRPPYYWHSHGYYHRGYYHGGWRYW